MECCLTHFVPHVPILYPLKTSEKRCFQRVKNRNIWKKWVNNQIEQTYQSVFTCSQLPIETLEQGAKYVQS